MKKSYRYLSILSILSVILILSSCTTMNIKKAEVEKVKKMAIVSVYSNYGIVSFDYNKGYASMFADMARKNAAKENKGKGPEEVTGQQLLGQGQNEVISRFRSELGFQMQPLAVSMAHPKYKELQIWLKENYKKKLGSWIWILDELQPYSDCSAMTGVDEDAEMQAKLGEFCNALGVDSVAVVSFKFGYYSTFSIGGIAGRGKASIFSTILMVDKFGKIILDGKNVDTELHEGKSANTVGFVAGIMPFSQDTKPMFDEALQNSVKKLLEDINKEMGRDKKK